MNTWTATQGSLTVFINGKGAHRIGDQTRHCGALGQLIEGSANVIVGEDDRTSGVARSTAGDTDFLEGRRLAKAGPGNGPATQSTASTSSASITVRADPKFDRRATSDAAPQAGASAALSLPQLSIDHDAWIEIRLVGEDGAPVSGERYRIVTPDGRHHQGVLDDRGAARVHAERSGLCQVTFPDLDEQAWQLA
jgi:hypothetical protein